MRLLGYVRPYWKALALSLLVTALTAATEPLLPALMKYMLDQGFVTKEVTRPWLIPLALIGIFMLRGILGYLSSYGMSWVSNKVITDMRDAMFARLVRLPAQYFHDNASSVPITRIAYNVNGVAGAATSVITVLLRDVLVVIGLLTYLFFLNWQLTLVTLVMVPAIALMIRVFSGRLRAMSRAEQEGMAQMNQTLHESVACNRVIKLANAETLVLARFSRVNNALRGYNMRQGIAAAAAGPLVQICASVAIAVVVYFALILAAKNVMTVGSFVAFIGTMAMLLAPLKRLADVNAPLQRGLAAAESVFSLIDEVPEQDHGTIALEQARGRIDFEDVSFSYPHAERPALAHVNLAVQPGETIALVGPSGAGKTTFANLLPRFYHPTAGQIRLDGHDLQDITLASLRANLALVSQDVMLFNDTVANNIAYGSGRNASRDEIEAAAAAANALTFINALPEGFDTVIGENGTRLSGGQRQRIAIARALLKNAPVLILDEATSALDNESERLVQAALEKLMQGRTTLVIAHRLSTIENADRIVVLQHGRVIEIGSHRELVAHDGVYAQLYKLQFSDEAA
ncbi:MAG: lipid A export permease/ATP-binding protein MsbA [Burkholderiaceae bacterium]|nr:MAG: lipid A export permease/ATP-binding protein MsbA [Burkholderiaceae bacterium]